MAKFYGSIGYAETEETAPGVWEEVITERQYYGDILRRSSRHEQGTSLNDNINLNVQISIVADPFAYNHFSTIRYVEVYGKLWKVKEVEPQFPRLILTIGDVYNGEASDRTS